MTTSLTWQELPQWLLEPVMEQHLLLWEAAAIWDHCLLQTEEVSPLPKWLHPAAQRLALWEMEPAPTRH